MIRHAQMLRPATFDITCLHCKDHKGARDNPVTVLLIEIIHRTDISNGISAVRAVSLVTGSFHDVRTARLAGARRLLNFVAPSSSYIEQRSVSDRDKQVNNSGCTDKTSLTQRYRNTYVVSVSNRSSWASSIREERISERETKREVSLRTKRRGQRKHILDQSGFLTFFYWPHIEPLQKIFTFAYAYPTIRLRFFFFPYPRDQIID